MILQCPDTLRATDWFFGQIPIEWRVMPFKYLCCKTSLYGANIPAEEYVSDGVRFIRTTDIGDAGLLEPGGVFVPNDLVQEYLLEEGDFLISRSGTIGKAYIHRQQDGICAYAGYLVRYVLQYRESARYLFYITKTPFFDKWLGVSAIEATIGNVNGEKYANLLVPVPPIQQQLDIVNFLDRETTKLDAMLQVKERILLLLAEKRQAIITNAITRGANQNIEMQDSGVEWLGQIPSNWTTKRVKYLFRLVTEPAPPDNDFELLSLYTEVGVLPRKDIEARGNKATTTDNYWLVKPGDLVVNKLLAWMGAFGVSEYEGVTSPAYDILRPLDGVNPLYYHHLFRCGICFPEFRRRSTGIMDMRLRLYFDEFGDMRVPLPPLEEQHAIIEHIQCETAKLDSLRIAAERTIGLLKERRAALIAAAVTGKLEVN